MYTNRVYFILPYSFKLNILQCSYVTIFHGNCTKKTRVQTFSSVTSCVETLKVASLWFFVLQSK